MHLKKRVLCQTVSLGVGFLRTGFVLQTVAQEALWDPNKYQQILEAEVSVSEKTEKRSKRTITRL